MSQKTASQNKSNSRRAAVRRADGSNTAARNLRRATVLGASQSAARQSAAPRQHVDNAAVSVPWRLVSLFIIAVMLVLLYAMFQSDTFYVRSVSVEGNRYLTREEVFAFAGIASLHVFWVDPAQTERNIMRERSVASASVSIVPGAPMVRIRVEEREPVLVWEQAGTAFWIDVQGQVMRQREELPDLLRIQASGQLDDSPVVSPDGIDPEIVFSALALQTRLPGLTSLRYDSSDGLTFRDENGWDIHMGVGFIEEKLSIYRGIVARMRSEGITPTEISIVDPDTPFVTGFTTPDTR